jgi:hypothetical protein
MKEITLNNKEYLLVEVPNDAYDFYLSNNRHVGYTTLYFWSSLIRKHHNNTNQLSKEAWDIKRDNYTIVGKLSNILKDEDVCKGLVDKSNKGTKRYKNYKTFRYGSITAVKSFLSYLQSIHLNLTKSWILIQKL